MIAQLAVHVMACTCMPILPTIGVYPGERQVRGNAVPEVAVPVGAAQHQQACANQPCLCQAQHGVLNESGVVYNRSVVWLVCIVCMYCVMQAR
jgi:hypothetical protein